MNNQEKHFWRWSIVMLVVHTFVYVWLFATGIVIVGEGSSHILAIIGTTFSFLSSHRWFYMALADRMSQQAFNRAMNPLANGFFAGFFLLSFFVLVWESSGELWVLLPAVQSGLILGVFSSGIALLTWVSGEKK